MVVVGLAVVVVILVVVVDVVGGGRDVIGARVLVAVLASLLAVAGVCNKVRIRYCKVSASGSVF